ncbi:hypothetical protein D5086_011677 [Populus alba]|uniref:Uncharacterized protein n=1 Tax=Populus alba TaxID=43335 RepID=A0ACC4CFF6_POPAL
MSAAMRASTLVLYPCKCNVDMHLLCSGLKGSSDHILRSVFDFFLTVSVPEMDNSGVFHILSPAKANPENMV